MVDARFLPQFTTRRAVRRSACVLALALAAAGVAAPSASATPTQGGAAVAATLGTTGISITPGSVGSRLPSGRGFMTKRLASAPLTTTSTTATPAAPAGMHLYWSDEFTGTTLNTTRWKPYFNTYGSGNNELECNTPNNVAVANGVATITARKQIVTCPNGAVRNYSTAFLGSRETGHYYPLYGRYEARIRVPHGQGLWPAFWLRHRNGAGVAEVDIVELFHNQAPGKVTQTLHFPTTLGTNVSKKTSYFEPAVAGTGSWHTFAADIAKVTGGVKFTFYVDNVAVHSYTNTSPSAWTDTDPNGSWDIALNLAVGGNWVGNPEKQLGYLPYVNKCGLTYKAPLNNNPANCPTSGLYLAKFQAAYQIDYVRVWVR